ncbi:UDP-glucose dehydrogenase family protein [Poriferisphaera sp. WC338]|uniref:UDP-glucose dehydrogenase family protein n=1 Tax=Poriferisphaera sp. WC338 TaxID=3425129 RepID=UPI003D81A889
MQITMVGTGYVGLVTGTCFANTGNHVICLDVDQKKIEKLHQGISPIYEPGLDELIARNAKAGRLDFTTDKTAAYVDAEIIFIAVGTPSGDDGRADLKYVLAAAKDIGNAIESSSSTKEKIVVVKSTVPVGTNKKVEDAIKSCTSKTFHMASNPEFLKEGAAINDFNKPDRVVVGCHDKSTGDRMRDLYDPFVRQGNPIFIMDIPSAEMVKYAANCMLATKISFINEVANLCERYGADINEVRRGMCSDKRIGNQFLYPGLGYGGSCFPKDVLAMISMGQDSGHPAQLLESVHKVNQDQRDAFMTKINSHFDGADWSSLKVAVWGIAFKPGTDDIREAPSITLMQKLLDKGVTVTAFDPVAHETSQEILSDKITYADDAISALEDADALIVCTDWDEFKHPDFDTMRHKLKTPVIFDGRNIYRRSLMREHGFVYHSVGRASVSPETTNA